MCGMEVWIIFEKISKEYNDRHLIMENQIPLKAGNFLNFCPVH